MRILVVDDEYVSRTKLKVLLTKYGDCDAAPDGDIALRLLAKSYQEGMPYDLVTMDINMPGMSGQEVVRGIRELEDKQADTGRRIESKILMITASDDSKEIMSSFREGAEWYLVKPVTPDKVVEAMKKLDVTPGPFSPSPRPAEPAAAEPDDVPAAEKALVAMPDPNAIDCNDVDMEFWGEYESSTVAKLEELEAAAMAIERGEDVESASREVMRTLHSLKGEAGMIGLLAVQQVCHEVESLFRDEGRDVSQSTDLLLKTKDWIESAVRYCEKVRGAAC
jgi:two-component system chemotaxis response regulator CheY